MIKAILLATVVPFMAQHRNITPSNEVTTNFYGSVTGVVTRTYIAERGGGGLEPRDVGLISTNVVTNVVTKSYVEGLGVVGSDTNTINGLIRQYDITNLTGRINARRELADLAVYGNVWNFAPFEAVNNNYRYRIESENGTNYVDGSSKAGIHVIRVCSLLNIQSSIYGSGYVVNEIIDENFSSCAGVEIYKTAIGPTSDTLAKVSDITNVVTGVNILHYNGSPATTFVESTATLMEYIMSGKPLFCSYNTIWARYESITPVDEHSGYVTFVCNNQSSNVSGVASPLVIRCFLDLQNITNYVSVGTCNLCTVAAAQAMTNDNTIVRGVKNESTWDIRVTEALSADGAYEATYASVAGVADDLSGNLSWTRINTVEGRSNLNELLYEDFYMKTQIDGTSVTNLGAVAAATNSAKAYADARFVPKTRKINGQPLTSDITIEGMSNNAVVITDNKTKTKAGVKVTGENMEISSTDSTTVKDAIENTQAIVQTWESFLDGSNVVFSITNYISGAYNLGTAKLRILELRDGTNYVEVYNSRGEIVMHIDDFKTNDFRVATNQVITSVNEKISVKADKAWGKYTSSGGEAPINTVYMTAPNTVFAGGMEYERVAVGLGSVCILTTKGAPTYTQGDEGTFKFQDDGGTNYFGFAKSDSYTLGCDTDGITVTANIVTLLYNVTMRGTPCVWYKQSLEDNTPWEQLNTPDGNPIPGASKVVTWDDNPDPGTKVCYLNCSEPSGFFKATIEVAGMAKFMTNMPADLQSGIFCTNTVNNTQGIIKPSYNGSQVIWTWSAQ